MTYSVKEIFYTLQGEGAQTGRASVFCRFSGCNLWSGLERDRYKSVCPFCDTDFVGVDGEGGGKFVDARQLADAIINTWHDVEKGQSFPYVVFTGGEPLLQLDEPLIELLHDAGFEVAVETNGTLKAPQGIDWICVSPKQQDDLQQITGNELKLLFPLPELAPETFAALSFEYFFLQAVDEESGHDHTQEVIQYCMQHPQWRVSLQTHKLLGLK
ncbi:MAG: 7-carboxy-7-deazaguanine synthase [gamma proteobacterium symbiont of Bathyaustriella thionipta]|nr:7-carboxy-7-deazaguanine synthase [gamma proteobacterium symbiont of Bathyaustriella thionipta]MCU7949793.1 7-carboxy-7-deazaguanine synthase [gamma proteobacterium symbiont of Bathyaustriella thionipta]MCU7954238.1 7-carboxy-7-deazaguanine synthase [gamma proteobacterium symbiont of Bathyaustriella thionipta]MCU7956387.1 7-carboxy-7-deazaguanine synthase [gamma proteobacterium symbiont of Bathyaustriella thionipta]MCU7968519.1 7-carboxy-7-deazaguanine synthase [gamma proteobacterium symbion